MRREDGYAQSRAGIGAMVLLLAASAVVSDAWSATKVKLFMLAGQSNAVGIPPAAKDFQKYLPPELQQPQQNVKIYGVLDAGTKGWVDAAIGVGKCCGGIGPELLFGHDMATALNETIYIVKGGVGATTFGNEWRPPSSGGPGDLYSQYVGGVHAAITALGSAYEVEIAGMIWMHGESDGSDQTLANEYRTNLTNFIKDIRAEFKVPNMPFVTALPDSFPQWWVLGPVRQAMRDVARSVPNVAQFDTYGFPKIEDGGHYNTRGQMVLGSDFAANMLRLMKNPAPGSFVVPSDPIAYTTAAGKVQLTWRDNSSGETGFTIERRAGSGAFAVIGTASAGTAVLGTYSDNATAPSTLYSYRVKAVNGSGSTGYTEETVAFPAGTGTGLKAQYFTDNALSSLSTNRVDTAVNFTDVPGGAGNRSMRWTGFVQPRYSETYTFFINSDMCGRLWVNDSQIVNQWTMEYVPQQSLSPIHCGSIQLTAGQYYPVKLEYYVNTPDDVGPHVQLFWMTPVSQPREIVPKSQLHQTASTVNNARSTQPGHLGSHVISVAQNGGAIELDGLDPAQPSTAVVSDVQGRTLRTASMKGSASVNLRSLGNGACLVSAKNGQRIVTRMVVVQR